MNQNQQDSSRSSSKHYADDMSGHLSPMLLPAPKQLKFTPGIVNGPARESVAFLDQTGKVIPLLLAVFESVASPLINKGNYAVSSDSTGWTFVNEEIGSFRANWKTLAMEEESSSVAASVQMEVAETMETLRVDQTQ